jgi:hypothetical protein
MRVVSTHEMHVVALHALEPHPNICLDVLHDVTNVEMTIGVRQGSGDEKLAWHRNRGALFKQRV